MGTSLHSNTRWSHALRSAMGSWGCAASLEQPMVGSRPRTFIAGLFDTAPGEMPLPKLVSGPDWLRFQLLVAGEPLALEAGQTLAHGRTIDFRRGVLRRRMAAARPRRPDRSPAHAALRFTGQPGAGGAGGLDRGRSADLACAGGLDRATFRRAMPESGQDRTCRSGVQLMQQNSWLWQAP